MLKIDEIKKSINKYVGIYQKEDTLLEKSLLEIVNNRGKEIYKDEQKLIEELQKYDVTQIEIHQICMIINIPSFKILLDDNTDEVFARKLDYIFKKVIDDTGLAFYSVQKIVDAISCSLGFNVLYRSEIKENQSKNMALYTESVHTQSLKELNECFDTLIEFKRIRSLPQSELAVGVEIDGRVLEAMYKKIDEKKYMELLLKLSSLGVPKAKYYLGYTYVHGLHITEKQFEVGVNLLESACNDGDSDAAAALADIIYLNNDIENYDRAYELYTGFGASAIDNNHLYVDRRKAITEIINQKVFNKKLVYASVILLISMILIVFISPSRTLFPVKRVFGVVLSLSAIVFLGVSYLHYKEKPYGSFYHVPFIIGCIWIIYFIIRLF